MLNAGSDLSRGLAVAKALFGNAFQPSESLKALTWFEGGDLQLLSGDEKRTLIEAASRVWCAGFRTSSWPCADLGHSVSRCRSGPSLGATTG